MPLLYPAQSLSPGFEGGGNIAWPAPCQKFGERVFEVTEVGGLLLPVMEYQDMAT